MLQSTITRTSYFDEETLMISLQTRAGSMSDFQHDTIQQVNRYITNYYNQSIQIALQTNSDYNIVHDYINAKSNN